jgi:hypothetical protein
LVDGDEEIELAFSGAHLGQVDMEEADRISGRTSSVWFVSFHL